MNASGAGPEVARAQPTTQAEPGAPPLSSLPGAGLRFAAALATRPVALLRRGGGWVADLGRAGLGLSPRPTGRDDATCLLTDPVRRRALQAWLATVDAVDGLVDDAGGGITGLGPDDAATLHAALSGLSAFVVDPAGPTAAVPAPAPEPEPVGAGPVRAERELVRGRDVAATPGAVVLRTPMFELLQYLPASELVHDTPLLVVPPPAHRYWLADLAPRASLVEHLRDAGLQVFVLSWRPGDGGPGDTLDARVAAVLSALNACTRITRSPRASLVGVREGGLLTAAVRAHLATVGLADRVAAAAWLGATADDDTADGIADRTADHTASGDTVAPEAAAAPGADGGTRTGRALREWARDVLPVSPGLSAGLASLSGTGDAAGTSAAPNTGTAPDTEPVVVLGSPVAPSELPRAGLVVPAAAGQDAWWAGDPVPDGPGWDDLTAWLREHCGPLRDAPPELGGRKLPALFPAPGTYVDLHPGDPHPDDHAGRSSDGRPEGADRPVDLPTG
ncbi:hypothetical protein [Pseudonocardia phyllosphaerae]|uniref:hypothetical protein n=1 Tax=Pseudonocardia phyllosphaerae TaxID=3390502 RepID=UPI00397B06AF